jgi:hypothetical protein
VSSTTMEVSISNFTLPLKTGNKIENKKIEQA